jgi:hypothetical protein
VGVAHRAVHGLLGLNGIRLCGSGARIRLLPSLSISLTLLLVHIRSTIADLSQYRPIVDLLALLSELFARGLGLVQGEPLGLQVLRVRIGQKRLVNTVLPIHHESR